MGCVHGMSCEPGSDQCPDPRCVDPDAWPDLQNFEALLPRFFDLRAENAALRTALGAITKARDEALAERDALRARIAKLVELFEDSYACDESCDLAAILAWVDPADHERNKQMVHKREAENEALRERVERLEAALTFYATHHCHCGLEHQSGERARAALERER